MTLLHAWDDLRVECVEVMLLGGFEVRVDGQPVAAAGWSGGRARDLVKLLALTPRHRLSRDGVLDALWPRLGVDAAVANLHKAAHHGRRALGDPGGIVLRGGVVMLAPGARVETDVERFEASLDPADYPGDLLPDDSDVAWVEEPRRLLRGRLLEALQGAGRWEELAAADPADETAALAVMRARFAEGDRRGALAAFERLNAALEVFGLSPGLEALALNARVAGGAAFERALATVELELVTAPLTGRAELLATRADLLLAVADRGAATAYAEAAVAAGPEGTALRIRQAWAQLAGGDAVAARATLAALVPGSVEERVPHLLAQGAAAWFGGDVLEAGRFAAEAESLAAEAGLLRETRMAVQLQGVVAHSTGEWPAVLRDSLDSKPLPPGVAGVFYDGQVCVAEFALTSGEALADVGAVAAEIHAAALRSGARRAQVFAATVLGEVALVTGAIEEADARLGEAVRLSREIGAVAAEALASIRLGEVAWARGRTEEGQALFRDALTLSRWSPMRDHLLPLGYAALLTATEDPEVALEHLDDAEAYLRGDTVVCAYCGMALRVAGSVACARAGQLERAAAFLGSAEALIGLWRGGPWLAALDEARGELSLASGDDARALAQLRAASEMFARDGRKLDAARVEKRLAQLT